VEARDVTTRVVKSESDRSRLLKFISEHDLPFTATIAKGKHRTESQNRLQRKWMNEISEQLGDMTPEECRGYCKLTIGIPILRAENEAFCEKYDAIVKPLSYEQKLAVMMEPLDLPVTRIMTTGQKTRYLDGIYRHFFERGIALTLPADGAIQERESE
jgi:hypothetical protein